MKYEVHSACYDTYTQEDVQKYHEDLRNILLEANKKGTLKETERYLCQHDLYYLCVYVLEIGVMYSAEIDGVTMFRPWLFNRCKEVESSPDYHIDIWARDHFKSTIITIGKTIQDILCNPDITVCIYSYNASKSKAFVAGIRQNLERQKLRELFPDIIPEDTNKKTYETVDKYGVRETRRFVWTDEKFTVKRNTRKKECTVEGYGLVGAQPTGSHFDLLIYDDVVVPQSVVTQEQNKKTTEMWKMSLNTGAGESVKIRIIGTRYSLRDTYYYILNPNADKGELGGSIYTERRYPCYDQLGNPVLYSKDYLERKRATMVGFVWASQMLCDPQETSAFHFDESWIAERKNVEEILKNKDDYNFYIIVDPANTQKKESDRTAMWVIATGSDKKYYLADLIYDKLLPSQRRDRLFYLVNKWENSHIKPQVFYESNSMSSDIAMMEEEMKHKNYYFSIMACSTKPRLRYDTHASTKMVKELRIMALEPVFREHRIVPCTGVRMIDYEGKDIDPIQTFIDDEYLVYPFCDHDDGLDALSRIADLETGIMILFPDSKKEELGKILKKHKISAMDLYEISENTYVPF